MHFIQMTGSFMLRFPHCQVAYRTGVHKIDKLKSIAQCNTHTMSMLLLLLLHHMGVRVLFAVDFYLIRLILTQAISNSARV